MEPPCTQPACTSASDAAQAAAAEEARATRAAVALARRLAFGYAPWMVCYTAMACRMALELQDEALQGAERRRLSAVLSWHIYLLCVVVPALAVMLLPLRVNGDAAARAAARSDAVQRGTRLAAGLYALTAPFLMALALRVSREENCPAARTAA